MPTAVDTAAVQAALAGLAERLEAARPAAPGPGDQSEARRRRLAWHLADYLLPRVRDLEAPLVCILLGSTGAGKSSLLNGLAGAPVSPSGVVRPTTMRPVVLLAPGQVDAFMAGKVLAALADADRLQLAVHDGAFDEIALVDAPDVDSVEAENRKTAEELLQAADLCVFVTTAQRYADAVPWEFLRQAKARGVPLLVVVNRLPRREADRRAVLADARRRFEEAGLGTAGPGGRDLPLLGVVEGARDPATDGLEAAAIEPVRRALAELAADPGALTAVKAQALRGALAGLPAAVAEVAADLEADRRRAAALRIPVERAYDAEQDRLQDRLAGGDFLRGEVMRSWQEFVGVGDIGRWLSSGIGRVRSWLARHFQPARGAPELQRTKDQAFEELVGALVRHADVAAGHAATEWAAEPAGALLLEANPGLWGHGPELETDARAELTAWLGRLTRMVEERGQSRRAFAFAASLGVNAIGVVAMLAVFAHSAGLTGGEVAIAGGTAVVNQKLLEALIGEAAVADIIRAAERDLRHTLRSALEGDARRFLDLLARPGDAPEALRSAADRVLTEAERLIATLGRAQTPR
ncbi:MAG TPA: GTPase [Actinomycetes bacterium]|nr:GTPase [Actinomycetes bacterium]